VFNKVLLIGNLGQDPELRMTPNQTEVVTFSLATSKKYQGQTTTQWHKVIVYGKQAKPCHSYLKKGSKCLVEGEINYRSWNDQQGQKKYVTEIIADNVRFMETNSHPSPQVQQQQQNEFAGLPGNDGIPF